MIKVKKLKKKKSDGWWRFACGDVFPNCIFPNLIFPNCFPSNCIFPICIFLTEPSLHILWALRVHFYFFCPAVCCRGLAGPWLGYTGVKLWPHWILTLSNRSPVIKARARKKTWPHEAPIWKLDPTTESFALSSTWVVQIFSKCPWSGGFSGLCGAMWWTHFISVR